MVFVNDIILTNPFIEDWKSIRWRKGKLTTKNKQNKIKIDNRTNIEYARKYYFAIKI